MDLPPLTGKPSSPALGAPAPASRTVRIPIPPANSTAATSWIIGITAVIALAGFFLPGAGRLAVIVVAMVVFVIVLGQAIVHLPFGALIDDKNVMSLPRFQLIVWTIVILSSYLAYAFARMRAHEASALEITLDPTLLTLMGISSASFVGAPLVLGTKKDKTPAPGVIEKTAVQTKENPQDVDDNNQGTLYANTNASDAQVTDMFQGDELGNTMHVDLGKLQMFFFTLIAALAYLVLALKNLHSPHPDLGSLPSLSPGFVTALGLSHAGYLGSSGIDHTPLQK